ncbi:hypothetical protein EOS97_26225 (plasmid) [Salmonella sp. SSDFZ54]|nr:hypothetical protein [Salmonella sp. SSDFZ54]AZZ05621.1 hypothetical protein EOS97_26225 [Salmonella sp. SSDFZ54]
MGSCAAPSAKGDDKFITTDYLQQCRIEIGDFDNLHVTATTKEEAVHRASEVLLRTLAIAAQKGERVPSPGALPVNDPDYIMICPLNPGNTPL